MIIIKKYVWRRYYLQKEKRWKQCTELLYSREFADRNSLAPFWFFYCCAERSFVGVCQGCGFSGITSKKKIYDYKVN